MNAVLHHERWRDLLVDALSHHSEAVLVFPDQLVPGEAILAGADAWRLQLRLLGIGPGERVVLALPPGPGFVMALIGGWLEGVTLAPVSGHLNETPEALERVAMEADAAAIVGTEATAATLATDSAGMPIRLAPRRETRFGSWPEARLLLRTSGTTGTPRTIALSDSNLMSVVSSHLPHLDMDGGTFLSVLPWHHAFGLVITLLPALITGTCVVRERSQGRDALAMLDAAREWSISHGAFVPLQVRRLMGTDDGARLLRSLHGGLVGGAPISAPLARSLLKTRLAAGYGQTEAGPGITLGAPGEWSPGFLGRPVGCTVRRSEDGRLLVKGGNVSLGEVSAETGLLVMDPERELDTGDLALEQSGAYWFLGRADHAFKLANGRFVDAAAIESRLRSLSPMIEDAAVTSRDGERLDVDIFVTGAGDDVDRARVLGCLGSLATRVGRLSLRHDTEAMATPKGAIDRARLVAA